MFFFRFAASFGGSNQMDDGRNDNRIASTFGAHEFVLIFFSFALFIVCTVHAEHLFSNFAYEFYADEVSVSRSLFHICTFANARNKFRSHRKEHTEMIAMRIS